MIQAQILEKVKTRFISNNIFFFFENHAGYEEMWTNTIEHR